MISMELMHVNATVETVDYGESVIPNSRLLYLYRKCCEILKHCPGNILEVGVYKGGTLKVLSQALMEICPQYKIYGIDTFTGHPYSDGHPVHYKGKYSDVDVNILRHYTNLWGTGQNTTFYEGRVEDIFSTINIKNLSFVHIDCDLYIPVKFSCEQIPSLINKNGLMYFDDYLHEHCPGATKAVEETFGIDKINVVNIIKEMTSWSCYIKF